MKTSQDCGCAASKPSVIEHLPALAGAPMACSLETSEMRRRADDFRAVFERLVSAERDASGFRWRFRAEPGFETVLRELAHREHACCPFLTFTITVSVDSITWEVRGSDEADAVLDVFYRMHETLGDVEALIRSANSAGLGFRGTAEEGA